MILPILLTVLCCNSAPAPASKIEFASPALARAVVDSAIVQRDGKWIVAGRMRVARDASASQKKLTLEFLDAGGKVISTKTGVIHNSTTTERHFGQRIVTFAIDAPAAAGAASVRISQ